MNKRESNPEPAASCRPKAPPAPPQLGHMAVNRHQPEAIAAEATGRVEIAFDPHNIAGQLFDAASEINGFPAGRYAHRLEVETETMPDGSSQVSVIHLVVTAGPAEFFKRFGGAG